MKQRFQNGSIVEIPISDGYFVYGGLCFSCAIAIYKQRFKSRPENLSIFDDFPIMFCSKMKRCEIQKSFTRYIRKSVFLFICVFAAGQSHAQSIGRIDSAMNVAIDHFVELRRFKEDKIVDVISNAYGNGLFEVTLIPMRKKMKEYLQVEMVRGVDTVGAPTIYDCVEKGERLFVKIHEGCVLSQRTLNLLEKYDYLSWVDYPMFSGMADDSGFQTMSYIFKKKAIGADDIGFLPVMTKSNDSSRLYRKLNNYYPLRQKRTNPVGRVQCIEKPDQLDSMVLCSLSSFYEAKGEYYPVSGNMMITRDIALSEPLISNGAKIVRTRNSIRKRGTIFVSEILCGNTIVIQLEQDGKKYDYNWINNKNGWEKVPNVQPYERNDLNNITQISLSKFEEYVTERKIRTCLNISRDSKYGPEDVYALSGFYKDRKRSREYLELDQKIANCSLSFIIKHKIGKKIIDEFTVLWRLDEGRWVLQSKFSSKTYQEK